MKKTLLKLILVIGYISLCINNSLAQNEDNRNKNWFWAGGAGLTFNPNGVKLTGSFIPTPGEGTVTMSDLNGNLLFYTDGASIWDNSHNEVVTGLLSAKSSVQRVVAVPVPCSASKYYIVVNGADSEPTASGNVTYSVYDAVTKTVSNKNTLLFNYSSTVSTEKITVVPHANGLDYWIIFPRQSTNIPVIQATSSGLLNAGSAIINNLSYSSYGGWLSLGEFKSSACGAAFNPGTNLTRLVGVDYGGKVNIFDFNQNTGVISNPKNFTMPSGSSYYGCAISPNGRYLFISNIVNGTISRFDLTNANPVSTIQNFTPPGLSAGGAMQIGSDGRLYMSGIGVNNVISLNNPDNATTSGYTYSTISAVGSNGYGVHNQPLLPHCCPTLITTAPTDKTITNCPGNTSFTAVSITCSNKWEVSKDNGATWTTITNGGVYSGATTGTLTLTGVDATYNGYKYRFTATTSPSGACLETKEATLTVSCGCPQVTGTPTISGTASFCAGSNTTLTANIPAGNNGFYYEWFNTTTNTSLATGTITTNSATTITTTTITTAGTYRFRIANVAAKINDNACYKEAIQIVTINAKPTINATGGAFCEGGTGVTLASSGAGTGGAYAWTPITNLSASNINNPVATPTTTTTYTVTGTDANGCKNTATATVTVNTKPTINATGGAFCEGGTGVTLASSGAGTGGAYAWTPITNLSASNINNPVAAPTTTTTYTVTGTDANGCKNTATATVTVNTKPTINATGGAFCEGGTGVTLTSSGAGTGGAYAWTPITNLSASNINNPVAAPTTTTTYTVTGTDANGCKNTATATVTVNTKPTINATGGAFCEGGTGVTLASSGAGTGGAYAWTPITNLSASNINNPVATPTTTTTYTVTGTDANGCKNTATATVTVNTKPTINATGGAFCEGGTGVTLTSSGAGTGGAYAWTPITNLSASNINNPVAAPTTTTTYTVTGTDANGCKNTATATVTLSPNPTALITSTALQYCKGQQNGVTLTATDAGTNTTYEWFKDGISVGPASGTFGYNNATAGVWTVKVTNTTTTCSTTSPAVTVIENLPPTASISTSGPALEYCQNSQNGVTLTATNAGANTTYEWFKGVISQSTANAANTTHNNATAGNWTVKVVNTLTTCFNTSSPVTVIEKTVPIPVITNTGSNSEYCAGDNGITINANPVTGATYEWLKDGVSSGNTIPHLNSLAGDWTLKITLNGCTETSVVFKVTEKPLPLAVITPSSVAYCLGTNGVTLTADDAGTGASYQWFRDGISQGNASANKTVLNALQGDWTLTVVLNGCSKTSAVTKISETGLPEAEITTTGEGLKYCANENGVTLTAKLQGVGATYEWFKDGILVATTNTNTLPNALKGDWTLKVTLGCSATTVTITPVIEKPIPSATFTTNKAEYCAGSGGVTLTAGAVTGATYEWINGTGSVGLPSLNNVFTGALAGDYTVKVTLNGCTNISTNTVITENALPTATISGNQSICNKVGVTANLNIALTGKSPWDVVYQKPDGSTITVNGTTSSPLNINESLNGDYKVLSVKDANCTGTFSGTGSITYKTSPTITNAVRNCTALGSTTFTVSFDITGGDVNTYIVTGATGTLTGSTWTSDPINENTTANITVNDAGNCNPYTESFTKKCSCPTDGIMSGGGTICNDGVTTTNINVALLGTSPWEIEYTVDNGSIQTITGIVSNAYTFTTSAKGVYKLTKVTDATCVGAANGTATVDYYNFPTATISGGSTICEGKDNSNLTVNLSGKGPWDFTVVDPSGNISLTSITANPYTYVASKAGTYTISAVKDANCIGRPSDISGSATVTAYVKPNFTNMVIKCVNEVKYIITMDIIDGDVNTLQVSGSQGTLTGRTWTSEMIDSDVITNLTLTDAKNCFPVLIPGLTKNCPCPTTATMTGDKTFCNDGTKTSVEIALQGTAPWDVTYQLGSTIKTVTSNISPLVISNIDKSGDYALVTVKDAYCTGTTSGSAKIIVNELPTSIVTGGGNVCTGTTIPDIKFTLTGAIPFNITYTDGTTPSTISVNSSPYLLSSPSVGSYSITAITDANGCIATSIKGVAIASTTPLTNATITGNNDICKGDQTPIVINFDNIGNAPFKVTYDAGYGYEIISDITQSPYQFNIAPNQTGSVKIIELSDKNNCKNSNITDVVNIDVTQYPNLKIINNSSIICSGSTTAIDLVSTAVGTENSTQFSWTAKFPATISGVISPGTGNKISQQLSNSSNNQESVVYTVTPVTYTTSNKACTGISKDVSVYIRKQNKPEIGDDKLGLCKGTVVSLSAGKFGGTYEWFVNNVKTASTNDLETITVDGTNQHVRVEYTDICGNLFIDTLLITAKKDIRINYSIGDTCLDVNTALVPEQLSFEENIDSWGYKFYQTGEYFTRTSLNPTLAYGFTHVGKYNVELSAYNNGCKIGDTIREIIIKDCYPKLVNTFTPGTDGTNDRWEIKDIENFPNAQLVIFNRWGVIVKEYPRGYIEPWDGTNSEGQTLEEGTYYYVLNLNRIKGEKGIYRGYITIIRQK